MIRARFKVNPDDPRPVLWPLNHPYWVTGYGDECAFIVAYADDETEIMKLWPDATEIDSSEADSYKFTDRFARPAWFEDKP